MFTIKGPLALWLVPAALAVGGAGVIHGSIERVGGGPSASQPIRCDIQVKERGQSVALEGVVFANAAVEGSYHLRVSKSGGAGSSDINQSGDFSAGPGKPNTLGTVMLGADGGSYTARLTVTWDGGSIECTERVRGTL